MASERQINVGGVLIGGGAQVAVQSMTTTKVFPKPSRDTLKTILWSVRMKKRKKSLRKSLRKK